MKILDNGDVVFSNVKALYPKLNRTYHFSSEQGKSVPCDALADGAAYTIDFELDKQTCVDFDKECTKVYKAAADADKKKKWKADPTYLPYKDTGESFTGKAKLKGAYSGEATRPPVQKDAERNSLPADFELTTGSKVNVWGKLFAYNTGAVSGVSLRLKGVQVLELAEQGEVDDPFAATKGFSASDAPKPSEVVADPTGGLLDGKDEQKTSNDLEDEIPFQDYGKKMPQAEQFKRLGRGINPW